MSAGIAEELVSAAGTCAEGLRRDPNAALNRLLAVIAADLLPRLRVWTRAAGAEAGGMDMELSEIAAGLSIVAADPQPRRAQRLAVHQLRHLRELAATLAAIEDPSGDVTRDAAGEERARSQLFFVAPPDRPPTEAHVLRHAPRPTRVWSPLPRGGPDAPAA